MTCHEIRSYFDRQDRVSGSRESASAVAGHLQTCPSCRDEFQAQIELLGILNLVRDSAPATSSALDAAVLQNFRAQTSHAPAPKTVLFFRQPVNALLWRGAIAATVVLAAIGIFAYRHSTTQAPIEAARIVPQAATQAESHPALPVLNSPANSDSHEVSMNPRPSRRTPRSATQPPALAANQRNSQPVAFNGLMYCDSLSCSEGMEIIRMQLPAPPAQSPDTGAPNPIYADVIVGPDGIARGYRIVR